MTTNIDFSDRINKLTCSVTERLFDSIFESVTEYDDSDKYSYRSIPFIYIDDASINSMIGVVISDVTKIVLFCVEVKQSSGSKMIRCFYSLSKKFLSYVHYNSGDVISNLSELAKLEPKLVSKRCNFYIDDVEVPFSTELNFDNCTIKVKGKIIGNKISDFLDSGINASRKLGYYITKDTHKYINNFRTEKKNYSKENDNVEELQGYMNDELNEENVNSIVSSIEEMDSYSSLIDDMKKCKTSQDVAINIARFIIECVYPILFNSE